MQSTNNKALDFELDIERQWVSNGVRYCIYVAGGVLIGINVATWSLTPFLNSNIKNPAQRVTNNISFIFQSLSGVALLIGGVVAAHDEPLARMDRERRRRILTHRQAVQERVGIAIASQPLQQPRATITQEPNQIAAQPEAPQLPPAQPNQSDIAANVIQVLNMYGVKAQFLDLVSGPSTIALYLLPEAPATVAKISNSAAEIQTFLGLEQKPLISPSSKGVQIELPRPDRQLIALDDVLPYLPADAPGKMSMLLGIDINFQPVFGDLDEPYSAHWLIAGESGSGKSVTLQSAALSLILRHPPTEVQLAIIDLKEETFPERVWGSIPWLWKKPCYEPDNALSLIEELNEEMERRKALFRNNNVANYKEYCLLPGVKPIPRIVLFSDETSDLSSKSSSYKQQFDQLAEPAAQKWRSFGINWILALQRCTEDKISRAVVSNLQARVCLKVIDGHNSKAAIGITGGEDLLGKGDMLSRIAGKLTRVQGCHSEAKLYLSKYQSDAKQPVEVVKNDYGRPPVEQSKRAQWISEVATIELSKPRFSEDEIQQVLSWLGSQTTPIHPSDLRQAFEQLDQNTACFLMERAAEEGYGKVSGDFPNFIFSPSGGGGDFTTSLHQSKTLPHQDSTTFEVSTGGDKIIPENWVFPDPFSPPSPLVERIIMACKNFGYSQNQAIAMIWGLAKSGTDNRYKAARDWYQSIGNNGASFS